MLKNSITARTTDAILGLIKRNRLIEIILLNQNTKK